MKKVINGTLYTFFEGYTRWESEKKEVGKPPHVLCECGNTTFTIHYGDYCCKGRCTTCNKDTTLYDG